MSRGPETIIELVRRSAALADRPVLLVPDRQPLSYGELTALIERTGRQLRALGLGARARIAVVLPNGPEAASADELARRLG
jgi:acyl-CoA synthetase (AMP-forming)/AMP-acid ligase II